MGRFSEALTEAYQASMAAKLGLRAYDKTTAVRCGIFSWTFLGRMHARGQGGSAVRMTMLARRLRGVCARAKPTAVRACWGPSTGSVVTCCVTIPLRV